MPATPLAIFDFDGTLTTRDTFGDFCLFVFGPVKCMLKAPLALAALLWAGLRRGTRGHMKEAVFAVFFRGMALEKFNTLCGRYCRERLSAVLSPRALDKVRWHVNAGHRLIIISASPSNWIEPWALANGFSAVLATGVQVEGGNLTGRFSTPNCYGPEKVVRFNAAYARGEYHIYSYGDSPADKYILALADEPFFRRFE